MSFFRIEGLSDPVTKWTWGGLRNYEFVFGRQMFRQSFINFIKIWFFGGVVVMAFALLFAVILTSGVRGKSFFRSVIYLPNVISAVALGAMWLNYIYNPEHGFLHDLFAFLGFEKLSQVLWTGPGNLFWAMLWAYCFGMVGYHMLIFMSGIEKIGADYYEAATLAGANIFQKFTYITFPLLKGSLQTNIVMWTVSSMNFFVWSQIFTPVSVSNETITPMMFMYDIVFGMSEVATANDAGAGAAVSVLMVLVVLVMFGLSTLIVRNDDVEL